MTHDDRLRRNRIGCSRRNSGCGLGHDVRGGSWFLPAALEHRQDHVLADTVALQRNQLLRIDCEDGFVAFDEREDDAI